jgi:hypothetical protein
MNIDRRLNLVVPIYDADGKNVIAQAHSVPLSVEIVDRHAVILAQTYAQIFSRGLGIVGGPAIALRLLKEIAVAGGKWDDAPGQPGSGVANGLVAEMRRLTNIAVKEKDGTWAALPLAVAVDRGTLSAEDAAEAENAIAFFTVASAMLPRAQRRDLLEAALGILGAQVTSSTFTDLCASLRTSTATGSSGEKSPAPVPAGPHRATATRDGKPASVPV